MRAEGVDLAPLVRVEGSGQGGGLAPLCLRWVREGFPGQAER